MTKTIKKFTSVFIAMMMVMILGVTSLALDVDISRPGADTATHTYKAYKVFTGVKETVTSGSTTTEVLTQIGWGNGVNSAALLSDLKDPTKYADAASFTGVTTAEGVANIIAGYTEEEAMAFAKIVAANVNEANAITASGDSFTGLDTGYYLITDAVASGVNGAASAYMLKVVDIHTPNGVADAKEEVPTLDKKIVENSTEVVANKASVGDSISYRITSKVPDLTKKDYEDYWFIVSDTFCKGLKFNNDVKVYIGEINAANQYPASKVTVTPGTPADGSAESTVYISLEDFIDLGKDATKIGKNIYIEYTAELTKYCDMTAAGNVNTAELIFSNNPYADYSGTYTPGGNNPPTGKTPESKTKTYTTGIAVIKVDDSTPANRLHGAEFEIVLSGTSANVVVVEQEVYTANNNANPAYYKLADGSYSTTAPAGVTNPQKYEKAIVRDTQTATGQVKTAKGTVDAQGYLVFEGLGEGEYTISESKAPTGYIADSTPHTVVIGHSAAPTFDSPNWTYSVDGGTASAAEVTLTFVNVKTTNLPETGGIGTTVFYVAGSVMLLAGASLLVLKKRMGKEETK